MDVTTTFLHGDLDERILMEQPKGFESRGKVEHVYSGNLFMDLSNSQDNGIGSLI